MDAASGRGLFLSSGNGFTFTWRYAGVASVSNDDGKNRRARLHNQERLRDLRRNHGHDVEIFCSHDLYEFERLSGRSAQVPIDHLVY